MLCVLLNAPTNKKQIILPAKSRCTFWGTLLVCTYLKHVVSVLFPDHSLLACCVAKVETPDMLKARNALKGKYEANDKVVKRELCSILSRGTRTYCFLDDVSSIPDGSPRSVNMILSIKVRNH